MATAQPITQQHSHHTMMSENASRSSSSSHHSVTGSGSESQGKGKRRDQARSHQQQQQDVQSQSSAANSSFAHDSSASSSTAAPRSSSSRGKGQKQKRGLSASAAVFIPSSNPIDDFVPGYRPPNQQPYTAIEHKMKNEMQHVPPAAVMFQPIPASQPASSFNPTLPSHPQPHPANSASPTPSQLEMPSQQRNKNKNTIKQQPNRQQQSNQQQQQHTMQTQQSFPQDASASASASASANPPAPSRRQRARERKQQLQQQQQQQEQANQADSTQSSQPSSSPPSSGRGSGRVGAVRSGKQQQYRPVADGSAMPQSPSPPPNSGASASSFGHVDNTELAKTLTEQLVRGRYECVVCADTIGRRAAVWSCTQCYRIFHLKCIKGWHRTSVNQQLGSPEWRCPGCQYLHVDAPSAYYCFCGQTYEPDYSPFLTPHACSNVCNKTKGCGDHKCTLPCHPASCPPCRLPGPERSCACGATVQRTRCGQNSEDMPTCNAVCNKQLNCGRHRCNRTCHNGPCDVCTEQLDLTCFCGQHTETRTCGSSGIVVDPNDPSRLSFSCSSPCSRPLDCGNHKCTQICHPLPCKPCERQPPSSASDLHQQQTQSCACGKVRHTLQEIQSDPSLRSSWLRKDCLEPLPSCGSPCGKLLNCDFHRCTLKCGHDSPCGMTTNGSASSSSSSSSSSSPTSIGCNVLVKRQCRCSAQNIVEVPCTQIRGDSWKGIPPSSTPVKCDVRCRAKLSCRKHQCNTICCPRDDPQTHVCAIVCGKPLDCGHHTCDQHCHTGSCKPCAVVYREGVVCACGRTRTPPNVRCGDPAAEPRCPYPCSKPRTCDPTHRCPQVCHSGPCAPCVVLTNKLCAGGHKRLNAVACSVTPSCGTPCKKLLRCGQHHCNRLCHAGKCVRPVRNPAAGVRQGWSLNPLLHSAQSEQKESEASGSDASDADDGDSGAVRSCHQKCGLARPDCSHPCQAICHPNDPCPTDVTCREQVRIYCACKRLSKVVTCGSGGSGESHDGVDRVLECTQQCEVESRNARLRDALNVSAERGARQIPFPTELLSLICEHDLFERVLNFEKQLAEFLSSSYAQTKTLPPMPHRQRWLLHTMAQFYNMESESFDQEPRRSVRLVKTERTQPPTMKLTDAIKLYRASKSTAAAAAGTAPPFAPPTSLHLYDLDVRPSISPADLNLALHPYLSDDGASTLPFRVTWLDDSHALIVFSDNSQASRVRQGLERRGLFRSQPDEWTSYAAKEAWRAKHAQAGNAMFRKHHGSSTNSSRVQTTSSSAMPATTGGSAWDDDGDDDRAADQPAIFTSDAMDDAEFDRLLEGKGLDGLTASASPVSGGSADSSASHGHTGQSNTGSVVLSRPQLVSTTNQWGALGDSEAEEEEEEEAGAGGNQQNKSRMKAHSNPSADDEADGWERLAEGTIKPEMRSTDSFDD